MIFNLFGKSPEADAANAVYGAIVAQSRQRRFYAEWGVPDTVTGRFDMVSLHMALLLKRLNTAPDGRALGQAVVEMFFRDMDRSLRELGVGDLSVPKKVKTMGNLFYGLAGALETALREGESAVEAVLVKNVLGLAQGNAAALAAYLVHEDGVCSRLTLAQIRAGALAGAAA